MRVRRHVVGILGVVGAAALHPAASAGPAPNAVQVVPLATSPASMAAVNGSEALPLYLEVTVNSKVWENVVPFYEKGGRLFIDPANLVKLGLKIGNSWNLPASDTLRGPIGDTTLIALDHLPGLRYQYDSARQAIDFYADERLAAQYRVGERQSAEPVASDIGLVVNYDGFMQASPNNTGTSALSVSNEERLFSRLGVFDSTSVVRTLGGINSLIRLDTLWNDDNPVALTTATAGDFLSSSLNWTRSVRLGGFQYRSNFALRPDLITFPTPTVSGSAAVPSTVDLYINNIHQFSSEVPSGPFVIVNPVALTGSGQARLVVRDDLGREVSTTMPLYVDSRMVAAGLNSYSVETGFLRRDYGLRSFDYGQTAAYSGSWRTGLSDALTIETHGEFTAGLYNGGSGALLRLGQLGVVNAAIADSHNGGNGSQASLGYQWIQPRFGLVLQTTRNFHQYQDLATIGGLPPPRIFDQVNLSIPTLRAQSVGLSYIHTQSILILEPGTNTAPSELNNELTRVGSVTYSGQISRKYVVFANAYKDFDATGGRGVWIGLSVNLGNRISGLAGGGRSQDLDDYSVSVTRTADYSGGLEWGVQDSETGQSYSRLARADYLGRYGDIGASAQDNSGQSLLSLDASGGLVFMDGVVEPSRRVYDSFALVSTDGIGGVPVLNQNRLIGNTDSSGHLLIPDLNSYQHNYLEVDSLGLPVDTNIPSNRIDVVPRSQSGVLAHFVAQHYTGGVVLLVNPEGIPLPPGTLVKDTGADRNFVVGYDGEVFIETFGAHIHLHARNPDQFHFVSCDAVFDFEPSKTKGVLPTIGPVVCKPDEGPPT